MATGTLEEHDHGCHRGPWDRALDTLHCSVCRSRAERAGFGDLIHCPYTKAAS